MLFVGCSPSEIASTSAQWVFESLVEGVDTEGMSSKVGSAMCMFLAEEVTIL